MGRTRSRDTEHPQTRLDHGGIASIIPSEFTSGFELIVDGTPQSHVDLDDPTHLHFEYIVRMGAVIDQLAPGALTAVHLGAGALTIPRYIEATRPGSRQQVIELEAPLAQLVREHLPLPKGAPIRIRIGDAREGVAKLPSALRAQCDLVVSDVVMPEMDGPTLLKELRQKNPELKIIFVSGYAEEAFEKSLPKGQQFNFLAKPFTLKQLIAQVKETMAG